jgi:FkbH-like protein/FkbM family methyltransferase
MNEGDQVMPHSNGGSGKTPASFDVDVASFPYLADHGFQDMVVLPGAFYIELALRVHQESLQATVAKIKRIEFRNPVILSAGKATLSVEAGRLDEKTVRYKIHESSEANNGAVAGRLCAILEIEDGVQRQTDSSAAAFSVTAFQQRAIYLGDQAKFYRHLRANGNQYGPQFQNLLHVWRAGNEALGRLRINRSAAEIQHHLDPVLVDGVIQLLSAFFLDAGQTFILQGIEGVTLFQPDFPDEMWVRARLRSSGDAMENGRIGDVDVFDDAGLCRLKLQGVRFTYLERQETHETSEPPKTKVVVAATFTAEPVEDSLQFWGDYLEFPVQVSFALYNQVFQELLNPASQMRRNQEGVNVILLNLDDWAAPSRSTGLKTDPEKAAADFGGLARQTLPNGLEIAHLNRHETEYVFKEIFEDQCYLRHGIHLAADATVIDIGANIGLFSLFVRSRCPQASVYAFEPSPVAFRALSANCKVYGPRLTPFNAGVSERRGSATLTFYDKSSVFSSFHPSADEDRQAIQAVVANMVRGELKDTAEPVDAYVSELMADRLEQQTFKCPLLSVSDIIRDNNLQRVNLLKVDAEKCELEILRGIEEPHWALIDQVVIEVHDRSRRAVAEVQDILTRRGFQCAVEEENLLAGSGLFNVYAIRPGNNSHKEKPGELSVAEVQSKADEFVRALDAFMRVTGVPTILCLCPTGRKNLPESVIALTTLENQLIAQVQKFPNVAVIGSTEILARYPAAEFHDLHANDLGHVPYTPAGFAAIGTSVFRKFTGLRKLPHKVIVLDCDNTLWCGVSGEEGPLGVTVTPAQCALQEFMLRQMNAGRLLCLNSKNSEEDVWAVFAQNPGMVLKREHLAAWRINWSAKSENLRSLARELNLGLESVVFLDDNPVECAEVRAQCPEVLTLQLPTDSDRLEQFLDHAWVFDLARLTEEDRTRTQKVLENAQREKYRGQVSTLKDFINGLQLRVDIFAPESDQFGRISQLTLRTNQFNFTTIRRSESDIARFLESEEGHGLAVEVSDRFGDYGLIGLLLYHDKGDRYDVDTFLLSCRVLGRGVEHEILAHLSRLALEHGKQSVNFRFQPTSKNQPAWEFIQSVGAGFMRKTDNGITFEFPAAKLASLRYDPDARLVEDGCSEENHPTKPEPATGSAGVVTFSGRSGKFQKIAGELAGVKEICAAMETNRLRAAGGRETPAADELPATLARKILGIWRRAIGNPRIGMDDNFIEAGGTSLKAVQVVAALRRELQLQLSIVNIFECPTVRLLCAKLEPGSVENKSAEEARERGARRKERLRKRT